MKTDVNGCSKCESGKESYEEFKNGSKTYLQYDFRTYGGKLFSCVGKTLEECRDRKDKWLEKEGK